MYDAPPVVLTAAERAQTPYCGACLLVLGWLDLLGTTLFVGCLGPDLRPREARALLKGTAWDAMVDFDRMEMTDRWWFEKEAA